MKIRSLFIIIMAFLISTTLLAQDETEKESKLSSSTFSGLSFRGIGPALTSGRISDIAVHPENINEYFVAVASGNVWKTQNNGTTWEPVFDNEGSYSIGCVTYDPNNPFTVWVGTGENNSQRSVGYGDGVYKSTDGGSSWKNMGLEESQHIAKIFVDPRNSDVVFVASQGPLWNAGGDRGLYKTTDGGATWDTSLYISRHTGVTDLVWDPRDPDVMYAASYQRRRHVWTLINGGPESAIYKTTDAGETWNKITTGLPGVDLGRIGLAISPVNPDYLYAIVEAADGKDGFYRSTNRGATWERRSDYIARSPQYYNEIYCDPFDVDRVYSMDTYTQITDDGGKTFNRMNLDHRHVDDHAFWVNPHDPNHYRIGGDGGLYESYDKGANWEYKANLPVTQFYRVAVDNTEPFYYVYGGTQDNNSFGGPSRTINAHGISNSDWFIVNGGDGFEPQIDPKNPDIVYAQSQHGGLVRFDRKSGERTGIQPVTPSGMDDYRWNWDSPLLISPHDNKTLFFAANVLFKSTDRGDSWNAISPDLTRQIDRNKLPVMGRVWSVDAVSKNRSTSIFGNIVALTESPLQEGLIYCGTDDGLIQVTKDGGKNWKAVGEFPKVPDTAYVRFLFASNHDANTVYATFDDHKRGDFKPYVLKSTDAGESWESISSNLPEKGLVYTIAEDHVNPELLFVGTEYGVHFTINGGEKWIELSNGLPTVAIRDMEIQKRENDLVLASFGRGFYILDDYTPLRTVTEEQLNQEAHIYPIKDALMYTEARPIGWGPKGHQGAAYYTAPNPEFGATFTYYLSESVKTLKQQRKKEEKELRKDEKDVFYPTWDELRAEEDEEKPYLLFRIYNEAGMEVRKLKTKPSKGMHRITWDLALRNPNAIRSGDEKYNPYEKDNSGFFALPGKYYVTMSLSVDGETQELVGPTYFNVKPLHNTTLPAEDRDALVAFQEDVLELYRVTRGISIITSDMLKNLNAIKVAVRNTPGAPDTLHQKAREMELEVIALLRELNGDDIKSDKNESYEPGINDRVGTVIWNMYMTTSKQTESMKENYAIAKAQFEQVHKKITDLLENDMVWLEAELDKYGAPYTPGRLPKLK